MADLLQVQIADLERIETQLAAQSDGLNAAQTDSQTIVNDIVERLQTAADDGENRMNALLTELDTLSRETLNVTEGAVWTGQNAERFRGATNELTATIATTNQATADAFGQVRTAIVQLQGNLTQLVADFQQAAAQADESTVSFREAVRSQSENYDQAFNQTLTT